MIYLDNASTTKTDKELSPIINRYLFHEYFNPGSQHNGGLTVAEDIAKARKSVEWTLGAEEDTVIFTSSGSEANTLAICGLKDHLISENKTHVITSKYEHKSVLGAMEQLERAGFDVTYLDVPGGYVDIENLKRNLTDKTGLVSIMYMNNELGTVNEVQKMHKLCNENGILFHTDCVQAFGYLPVGAEIADFITISGHKIHAPKGIGCLYARDKYILTNVICGGGQEFGLRPGTENVAFIAAFAHEAKIAAELQECNAEKIDGLSSKFRDLLVELCDERHINMEFNVNPLRTHKVCSIRFDRVDAETLMMMLSSIDVFVSVGSACSSKYDVPSHVLKAIGLTDEQARSTIRVSFSDYNTDDDVQKAAEMIASSATLLANLVTT